MLLFLCPLCELQTGFSTREGSSHHGLTLLGLPDHLRNPLSQRALGEHPLAIMGGCLRGLGIRVISVDMTDPKPPGAHSSRIFFSPTQGPDVMFLASDDSNQVPPTCGCFHLVSPPPTRPGGRCNRELNLLLKGPRPKVTVIRSTQIPLVQPVT